MLQIVAASDSECENRIMHYLNMQLTHCHSLTAVAAAVGASPSPQTGNNRVIEVAPATGEIVWTFAPKNDPSGNCTTARITPHSAYRLPAPSTLTLIATETNGCGSWVYLVDANAQVVWQYGGWIDVDQLIPVLKKPTYAVATAANTVLITDSDWQAIAEVSLDAEMKVVYTYENTGGTKYTLIQPTAAVPVPGSTNLLVTDSGANKVSEKRGEQ